MKPEEVKLGDIVKYQHILYYVIAISYKYIELQDVKKRYQPILLTHVTFNLIDKV